MRAWFWLRNLVETTGTATLNQLFYSCLVVMHTYNWLILIHCLTENNNLRRKNTFLISFTGIVFLFCNFGGSCNYNGIIILLNCFWSFPRCQTTNYNDWLRSRQSKINVSPIQICTYDECLKWNEIVSWFLNLINSQSWSGCNRLGNEEFYQQRSRKL